MVDRIEGLWQEHLGGRFPPDCRGEEVNGIELVLVDADTAGCVSTFLQRDGLLDQRRLAIKGLCYHALAVVVPGLEGEARDYFARLEERAGLILCELARGGASPGRE